MNTRQRKKARKRIYKMVIDDVAMEVSLMPSWRKRLFASPLDAKLFISYQRLDEIPVYVQSTMNRYRLIFSVSRVASCREQFDDGFVIFKFESHEFPRIVRFTGNNPGVI